MKLPFDEKYVLDEFQKLLAIDSTTGQFRAIQSYVKARCEAMGYPCRELRQGGLWCELGGEGDPIAVAAHLDDIGLMVRHVKSDGTLKLCRVGGLHEVYAVGENVRVYTRDGAVYNGTVCRSPNSIHVTANQLADPGDYDTNVCVVLDRPTHSAAETRALGIETGDFIALEPRFTLSDGYIKSRFVDDKACAAVLLGFMKTVREQNIALPRRICAYFTAYEEIGHGATWLPEDICDFLALDIAPTGPEQNSEEHLVTIFAKDASFPYHDEMTNELRAAARREGVDYCMDIFTPHYGTDADRALWAGHDIRHAAIGPGTSNSHGYERTHMDGLRNTYDLLCAYLLG